MKTEPIPSQRQVDILRWVGFLPAGILAAVLVQFPLHWVLHFTLVEGSIIQMPSESMAPIERFLAPAFSAIAFVYAGAVTAPRSHVRVSYILFAVSLLARLVSLLVALQLQLNVDLSLNGILKLLFSCLAGAAGVFMVVRREPGRSPAATRDAKRDERLDRETNDPDTMMHSPQVVPTVKCEGSAALFDEGAITSDQDGAETPVSTPDSAFSPLLIIVVAALVLLATNDATREFASLYAVWVIINAADVGATILVCLMASAPIDKAELFLGPNLAIARVRETAFSFRLIPIGGTVSLKAERTPDDSSDNRAFLQLPKTWRLSIQASGPLGLFLLSALCIGSDNAWHHLTSGFYQVVAGGLSPLSVGQSLLQKTIESLRSDFIVGLGLLAAKYVAFNLIPIPPLTGGRLIVELLGGSVEQSRRERVLIGITYLGLLFSIVVVLGWSIAIVGFAFGSSTGS